MRNNRSEQKTFLNRVTHTQIGTLPVSAIQLTTAAGVLAVIDILLTAETKYPFGLVRNESISFKEFQGNRFGRYYE